MRTTFRFLLRIIRSKDVLRTKGGMNSGILVEDIDIGDLREFQLKEYSLLQKDGRYKSTPPTIDKVIIKKKIKGENLFQYLDPTTRQSILKTF